MYWSECVCCLPYHERCIGIRARGCRTVESTPCRQRNSASGSNVKEKKRKRKRLDMCVVKMDGYRGSNRGYKIRSVLYQIITIWLCVHVSVSVAMCVLTWNVTSPERYIAQQGMTWRGCDCERMGQGPNQSSIVPWGAEERKDEGEEGCSLWGCVGINRVCMCVIPRHRGGRTTICMSKKPTPTSSTPSTSSFLLPMSYVMIRQCWCAHYPHSSPGRRWCTLSLSFFT